MFTKTQAFGFLAAMIAIAPSAAIAQEVPSPEAPQNQVSQTEVQQNSNVNDVPSTIINSVTRNKKSNLLPGVAGAVLNGVTGNKKNILPGVAGAVINGITGNKKSNDIVPGVSDAVNAVTNQQENNTDANINESEVSNTSQTEQPSNNSLPKTHLCNARGGVEASVQNLNPLNIASGIVGGVQQILGQKTESPNKLRANGNLGCLPLPR